jgi:regulator of sigma D
VNGERRRHWARVRAFMANVYKFFLKNDAVEIRSSTKSCDRASYKSIIRTERFALLTFCSCNPVDYLSANHFCIDDVSGNISAIGCSATKAADTTITGKVAGVYLADGSAHCRTGDTDRINGE